MRGYVSKVMREREVFKDGIATERTAMELVLVRCTCNMITTRIRNFFIDAFDPRFTSMSLNDPTISVICESTPTRLELRLLFGVFLFREFHDFPEVGGSSLRPPYAAFSAGLAYEGGQDLDRCVKHLPASAGSTSNIHPLDDPAIVHLRAHSPVRAHMHRRGDGLNRLLRSRRLSFRRRRFHGVPAIAMGECLQCFESAVPHRPPLRLRSQMRDESGARSAGNDSNGGQGAGGAVGGADGGD